MAKHADKFSLVRSVYHTAAAVHDTGHQMMQTGRLFQGGIEHPHSRLRARLAEGPEGRRAARTCCCRGRSAAPAATCRTARPPASSARRFDPFVLNADPSDPNFKVPDLLPPDYLTALRVDRRQQLARDGGRDR